MVSSTHITEMAAGELLRGVQNNFGGEISLKWLYCLVKQINHYTALHEPMIL